MEDEAVVALVDDLGAEPVTADELPGDQPATLREQPGDFALRAPRQPFTPLRARWLEALGDVAAAPGVHEHAPLARRIYPLLPAAHIRARGVHAIENHPALVGRPDDARFGFLQKVLAHCHGPESVVDTVP